MCVIKFYLDTENDDEEIGLQRRELMRARALARQREEEEALNEGYADTVSFKLFPFSPPLFLSRLCKINLQ